MVGVGLGELALYFVFSLIRAWLAPHMRIRVGRRMHMAAIAQSEVLDI